MADTTEGSRYGPGGTPTVVVVGAGFGGIAAGVKLRNAGIDTFTIIEGSPGIGGTWWDNRYPGAEVDVATLTRRFGRSLDHEALQMSRFQFRDDRIAVLSAEGIEAEGRFDDLMVRSATFRGFARHERIDDRAQVTGDTGPLLARHPL